MSECGPHHTYRGTPIDCEEAEGILRARINDLQHQAEEYEAAISDLMKCFHDMPVFDGFCPAHELGCQYPHGGRCSCGMKQWREQWDDLEYKTHAETIARAEQRKGD